MAAPHSPGFSLQQLAIAGALESDRAHFRTSVETTGQDRRWVARFRDFRDPDVCCPSFDDVHAKLSSPRLVSFFRTSQLVPFL